MFKKLRALFASLFGFFHISYTPPGWALRRSERRASRAAERAASTAGEKKGRKGNLKRFFDLSGWRSYLTYGGLVLVAAALVFAAVKRPDSRVVDFRVAAPPIRAADAQTPPPLRIVFGSPVADLALVGKNIEEGATLDPALQGRWVWSSDRELVFFPTEDWPIGTEYRVTMAPSLFSDLVKLKRNAASFYTVPFQARLESSELYVDPTVPSEVRARFSFAFTYPVDRTAFKAAVSMKGDYSVTFDDSGLFAYIVSAPLPVRDESYDVKMKVKPSYGAAAGGNRVRDSLETTVKVSGRYDSARIEGVETTLMRQESYEYRRLLSFHTSMGIRPEVLGAALEVYLLPEDRAASPGVQADKKHQWSLEEVDSALLAASTRLAPEVTPIEGTFGKDISFFFDAPSDRSIYAKVAGELEFTGGYRAKKPFEAVLTLERIPKEVRIMYEGSVLSMAGERTISLYANDIDEVVFEIGRIIPDQVNHFVSQTAGEYANPHFQGWNFGIENISSIYQTTRKLRSLEPGKVQYFSFDFNDYLRTEADPRLRYGLFSLRVSEYDAERKEATRVATSRFVLVTDLGLLVKRNDQVGYDLFVQSIHSGAPVDGATVEVVGKNGLAVFRAETDATGHAAIPRLDGFVREKEAEVFVVKKGADMSFIPVAGEGRFLNYSRFDIGGVHGTADPGFIDAYLFSDRGLYRPGDEARIGVVVKAGSWEKNLAGLPLEICVEDPRGVEIRRSALKLSASGFEEFAWRSLDTASTGKYQVKLYLARDKDEEPRLLGSTSIKVEEFRPDRLSIRSRIAEDDGRAWIPMTDLHAEVSLMNLYGTPAAGNAVEARLILHPAVPRLGGFGGYVFVDPYTTNKQFEENLGNLTTDEAGRALFPVDLGRFDKATFLLRVAAEGREKEGGRGVLTEASVIVSPLSEIVGYKADGDLSYVSRGAERSVRFIAVNADRKQVALPGSVLKIEESRYVSVLEKGADKLYHYRSVEKLIPVDSRPFPVAPGGSALALPTAAAGDFIVTLLDSSGLARSSFRYSVAGTGNLARSLDKNAELQIRLDRDDYAAGDRISVNVVAPYTGAGLITIERDRVYAWKWFRADTNASVQTITVPDGLDGTAYVNVSFLRAIDSREIYASPLSYGVAPFSVSRERRTNRIDLTVPEEVRGSSVLTVGYRTAKPGRIVVFGVDEGILQVAKYKSPQPLDHFFRKRALEVESLQILDLVLPEYSIIRELSAMGGDDDGLGLNLNPFKRKNKPPVVFWSGILPCDGTQRTVEYKVPDWFNGTIRVFAVAVSDDSIGTAEKTVVARNDFIVTPNVPVTLGSGDEFEVGVSVADDRKAATASEVSLALEVSDKFELLSPAAVKASMKRGDEKTWFFKLRVKDALGEGSLRFVASGGGLSSSVEESVSLRPAMPYRVLVSSGRLIKGEKEVPLERKMHGEFRTLQAVASYLPTGMSIGLQDYLDKYPYGCTEQILSRAFPSVALMGTRDFGVSEKSAREAFLKAQSVLAARQTENGGFGLWSARDGIAFITPYAMHFLTDAREAGLPVDANLFEKGRDALEFLASGGEGGRYADPRASVYAIYVLTRNGMVTTRYINGLLGSKRLPKDWAKGPEAIYLSGAYALLKQEGEAERLLKSAFEGRGKRAFSDEDYYYGPLAATSLCLYMAARHVPNLVGAVASKGLDAIAAAIADHEYNTLSSSYAILALASYARGAAGGAGDGVAVQARGSGDAWTPVNLEGEAVLRGKPEYGSAALKFIEKKGMPLYWQVTEAGFDLASPTTAERHGLEVVREYLDASNKPVTNVALGDEVRVRIRVRTIDKDKARIRNVAIVDLFPSGFELVRPLDAEASIGSGSLSPDFVEPREDRLLVFCTAEREAREYVYTIKSTVAGRFALPPAFAEAMYDLSVWALAPSSAGLTVAASGK